MTEPRTGLFSLAHVTSHSSIRVAGLSGPALPPIQYKSHHSSTQITSVLTFILFSQKLNFNFSSSKNQQKLKQVRPKLTLTPVGELGWKLRVDRQFIFCRLTYELSTYNRNLRY
jgi:hypothetical protein